MSHELIYLLLIFALLVIPRALQRFSLPAPLTCLLFGIIGMLWLGDQAHDAVIGLLATLGISSLFLFAGLEVDLQALRRGMWPLLAHLVIRTGTLFGVGWLAWRYAGLPWQAAGLLALALLTPSTGFIMDSLSRLGLSEDERFWVTSKAIAGELLALAALFIVLQAGDPGHMALSSLALLAMMIGLPLLFIALGRWVAPHAPGSEFSLLVMVGMVAAYITYLLGVYYLVGAFIAGLVARLLHQRMPLLASHENLHALRLFASFFVPFYFLQCRHQGAQRSPQLRGAGAGHRDHPGGAAAAHRRGLAAAPGDVRRELPQQPAGLAGAGPDADLHPGAGGDHARALPDSGGAVRRAAAVRRTDHAAAVAGVPHTVRRRSGGAGAGGRGRVRTGSGHRTLPEPHIAER
jgi:hypothetical protein